MLLRCFEVICPKVRIVKIEALHFVVCTRTVIRNDYYMIVTEIIYTLHFLDLLREGIYLGTVASVLFSQVGDQSFVGDLLGFCRFNNGLQF